MSSTVAADARKTPGKTGDFPGAFLLCLGDERFDIDILKIKDPVAASADEMTVVLCPRVKMVRSGKAGKLVDLPEFGQQIQVAVDRSQADIRITHPDIFIDDVRGRMIASPLQKAEYRLPLTAVLMSGHNFPPLRQKRWSGSYFGSCRRAGVIFKTITITIFRIHYFTDIVNYTPELLTKV